MGQNRLAPGDEQSEGTPGEQILAYDDNRLEGQFLAGDPDAVGEVIRLVAGVIGRSRFWSLRGELPDIHQECLRRIVYSLRKGRFDADRDFRAYVHGVARLTALEAVDKKIRQGKGFEASELAGSEAAANADRRLVARNVARKALESASPECGQLFRAYFFEEQTYREIAEKQQVPTGTVKSRLFRCLKKACSAVQGAITRSAR